VWCYVVKAMWCPFCHAEDVAAYDDRVGIAECRACHKFFNRTDEARMLFHLLWGKSQGRAPYDADLKQLWNRLREILNF
jgi:transcriptional regulator NrdR family protein